MAEALRDSTERAFEAYGVRGLWETVGDGINVQIPGTGDDGRRCRLYGSGRQPREITEERGESVADLKPGGGGQEGVGQNFQGDGAGGAPVRGGDMGTYPTDRAGPVELPARGRAPDHQKTTAERGGGWTYPPLKEAMQGAGFEGIRKVITRRQNTVAQYIATRPILNLCERATQRVGTRVSWRWWDQEVIDLKAAK